jgi:hypothetical protein
MMTAMKIIMTYNENNNEMIQNLLDKKAARYCQKSLG